MKKQKFTTKDLHSIAEFNKIVMNYLKMKRLLTSLAVVITLIGGCQLTFGQTYNSSTVKALYAKYPTVKSGLCPACKLWVNPYYKSIADTAKHYPLVTYEHYLKNTVMVAKRTGIFAAWHSVAGQVNEDKVYTAANKAGIGEIAKGHNQCWILNSFSYEAAILSDTYTFNAACEYQGQNIGTEIQSEENCRELLKTTDLDVWCGTFAGNSTIYFSYAQVKDILPEAYWKIIKYGTTTIVYWMPNLPTEVRKNLKTISYQELITKLGFDPCKTLK